MQTEDLKLAKCKIKSIPTSLFFEDFEKMEVNEKKKILSICDSCLIKDKCFEDASSKKDTYGVWGGTFFKRGKPVKLFRGSKAKAG